LIPLDKLREELLSKIQITIQFCYLYDNERESLSLVIPHSCEKKGHFDSSNSELNQIIHELSLSELMIGQHHKLLGALHYMVCSFNDIQIASFPLQNAVLMLAFSNNMNISSAESNLLFRNVRKIISECGLSRQQQNDE
jgi:hypothetical protein